MNENYAAMEAAIKKRVEECERKDWSRHIGAGWTEDDIENVQPQGETFLLTYAGHTQRLKIDDLNLRELDAIRGWLFKRIAAK